MSGFGNVTMWSYGICAYFIIPIRKYWSLNFWSRHGDKFVYILTILRYISLRWDVVCPLLDNMNTLFFHRSSLTVNISLSMILMKIIFLFWYIPLQRVRIYWRLRCQMRSWLIPWGMICLMQWNEMVGYVMTLIIAVGRNTEWIMTLNLCVVPLNKIL